MTPERYARVKAIFVQACQLPTDEQAEFLRSECGGDAELQGDVETLLSHHNPATVLDSDIRPHISTVRSPPRLSPTRVLSRHEVRRFAKRWGVIVGVTVLLIALGAWSHIRIKESLSRLISKQLVTVLNADIKALGLWLAERSGDLELMARERATASAISELAKAAAEGPIDPETLVQSNGSRLLHARWTEYLQVKSGARFAVVARSGYVLAASDQRLVGAKLNARGHEAIARTFAGETIVLRPHPQGVFTDGPIGKTKTSWVSMCAPVPGRSEDDVVAALCLSEPAEAEFSDILRVARIGVSGETYVFDRDARMLSESLFKEHLRKAGLLEGNSAIFHIVIRDPGRDLTTNGPAEDDRSDWPLTEMAAIATTKKDGVDVKGYRDYRGVTVVGAWRWLEEHDMGIVTEMDYDEAYAPLQYTIVWFWIRFGLLVAVGGLAGLLAMRVLKLQTELGVAQRIGQYTLEERIGEGGMGVVYRARHALLRRPTAVKVLRPEWNTTASIARFEREVQLASQLSHPNTIDIYDYGKTSEGVFYFVMEYLPGVSLLQLSTISGPVQPRRVVHILQQAARSLQEAHNLGLVHRDIKPANIVLCHRGGLLDFVKVLDFGLAREIEADSSHQITTASVLAGTPLYIAPERWKNPQSLDPRSDIYSLGAVAYRLLTGVDLYTGTEDDSILFNALNTVPKIPTSFEGCDAPVGLEHTVMSCLEKDPDLRPQTVAELLDQLEQLALDPWTREDAELWWSEQEQ